MILVLEGVIKPTLGAPSIGLTPCKHCALSGLGGKVVTMVVTPSATVARAYHTYDTCMRRGVYYFNRAFSIKRVDRPESARAFRENLLGNSELK